MYFLLNQNRKIEIPKIFHPKSINNNGNYIISLGELCKWLAERAQEIGVDIFTGFAGDEVLN